jgi:hypothetical protein
MNKNLSLTAAVIVMGVAVVLACGCVSPRGPAEPSVTPTPAKEPENVYLFNETSNNGIFAVPLDAEIRLTLPGNPTTGYTCFLHHTGDRDRGRELSPRLPAGKWPGRRYSALGHEGSHAGDPGYLSLCPAWGRT